MPVPLGLVQTLTLSQLEWRPGHWSLWSKVGRVKPRFVRVSSKIFPASPGGIYMYAKVARMPHCQVGEGGLFLLGGCPNVVMRIPRLLTTKTARDDRTVSAVFGHDRPRTPSPSLVSAAHANRLFSALSNNTRTFFFFLVGGMYRVDRATSPYLFVPTKNNRPLGWTAPKRERQRRVCCRCTTRSRAGERRRRQSSARTRRSATCL